MTQEIKATMNDDAEFAEHLGEDCKPGELPKETPTDFDDLFREEQNLLARKRARAAELRESASTLESEAEKAHTRAMLDAKNMRSMANVLDPPDDLGKCHGGAPRTVRARRTVAKAPQRRAKAAKPAKAPRAQAKRGKPAAGGSGAGNGKRGRKPSPPSTEELVNGLRSLGQKAGLYGGAKDVAYLKGWPEHTTKRRITEAAKAGIIRNAGSRKAPRWVVV